jgi:hypothetical protein
MTQPQQDPATDVGAALARLAEQTVGLQRQMFRHQTEARDTEARVTALTDAKFVTYRTLIDSQAEKVALALDATEKAIGKAEVATQKAIDKESAANADRFAAVNEFRSQLNDQARTFLPRAEGGQRMETIEKDIDQLRVDISKMRESSANLAGRMTMIGAFITVFITFVVLVANIVFN